MRNAILIANTRDRNGHKNPAWKRGYIIVEGYKLVSIGGKKRKFEHRMVMEKQLDRLLTRTEVIHHKNGNKLDNRVENLEVLTQSEHVKKHISALMKARWPSKSVV